MISSTTYPYFGALPWSECKLGHGCAHVGTLGVINYKSITITAIEILEYLNNERF